MLTALTVMVFIILVLVGFNRNYTKELFEIRHVLQEQNKILEGIRYNTDMDNLKNRKWLKRNK